MGMNIDAPAGAKVRFANTTAGYKSDSENAVKHLVLNQVYTVHFTQIHAWHTDVWLEEVPGIAFNSVSFEDYYPEEQLPYDFDLLYDIKTLPQFEQELKWAMNKVVGLYDLMECYKMAVYEYECTKCAHRFIKVFKTSESDTAVECPQCRAPADKQVSQSNFQLKGPGWAKDGYNK